MAEAAHVGPVSVLSWACDHHITTSTNPSIWFFFFFAFSGIGDTPTNDPWSLWWRGLLLWFLWLLTCPGACPCGPARQLELIRPSFKAGVSVTLTCPIEAKSRYVLLCCLTLGCLGCLDLCIDVFYQR